MAKPESRTLDEIVALYRLEPQLQDIYVEGNKDRSFIEWFLHVQGLRDVVVKDIGCVDVPAEMVLARKLEDNQRGRVITLAYFLEDSFGLALPSVSCIADGDFDHINSRNHNATLLLLTDYTSPELYFFNADSLTKLLKLALSSFPKTAQKFMEEIRPVLEDLFVVRMANASLGWGLQEVKFERSCRIVETGIEFDLGGYIARYLQANNQYVRKDEFVGAIRICKARLTGEPRIQIHGHDYVRLLA